MEKETVEQIKDLIHNQKWMSARGLSHLSEHSGCNEEQLAMGICGAVSLYLMFGQNAQLVANSILTIVPLLATFVFPEERPSTTLMFIYWGLFGITTSLDQSFEKSIPAYYLLKILLHAMLFLRPFNYGQKIADFLKENQLGREERSNSDQPKVFSKEEVKTLVSKKGKSPPPEKPDNEKQKSHRSQRSAAADAAAANAKDQASNESGTSSTATAVPVPVPVPAEPPKESEAPKAPATPEPPKEPETAKTASPQPIPADPVPSATPVPAPEPVPPPEGGGTDENGAPAAPSGSRTDCASRERFKGTNPMCVDSSYRLTTGSSTSLDGSGIETRGKGAQANLNDFLTWPTERIVFNGPFDQPVTYHIRIQNNAYHTLAYAIKSNCIPRITAYPPSGVLKSKAFLEIAIKCDRFDYDEAMVAKDRLAFEYVFVPIETTKFEFKLLQAAEFRRRKNLLIAYNP